MKKCTKCLKTKSAIEFHKNSKSKDGLHTYCKQCNNERASKNHKKLYRKNPQKYLKISKEFRKKHPKEISIRAKIWRDKLKIEILNYYSNNNPKCNCCGEKQFEFLTLDHINGGGKEDRKIRGWGSAFYYNLRKEGFPPGFQVLCYNCNMAKYHYKICPHKK